MWRVLGDSSHIWLAGHLGQGQATTLCPLQWRWAVASKCLLFWRSLLWRSLGWLETHGDLCWTSVSAVCSLWPLHCEEDHCSIQLLPPPGSPGNSGTWNTLLILNLYSRFLSRKMTLTFKTVSYDRAIIIQCSEEMGLNLVMLGLHGDTLKNWGTQSSSESVKCAILSTHI